VVDFFTRPIISVITLMKYPPLKGCGLSEPADGIATGATG
jgi:hypothetical protein